MRYIDETGHRYGRLTVIAPSAQREQMSWICRCACGATRIVAGYALRSGHTVSCGCHRREQLAAAVETKRPDETGHRYGRLTVVSRAPSYRTRSYASARLVCQCDCGQTCVVRGAALRDGTTRSCGCLQRDVATTHGDTPASGDSREYEAWHHMKARCLRPTHPQWKNYGGRGITVCARWSESFAMFLADMGRCPLGRSLDRIDNDAGYAPDNCRWATAQQQGMNRRDVHRWTLDGERISVRAMAEWLALPVPALARRLLTVERG